MDDFCGSQFWDINATWFTQDPNFTPCFQHTVLVWVPCLILWIFIPLEIYYIRTSKYSNIPWSFTNICQLMITTLLIILTISDITVAATLQGTAGVYDVHIVTPIIKLVTFVVIAFLRILQRKHGIMSSGTQFCFWFLLAILTIPMYKSEMDSIGQWNENSETIWLKYKFISCAVYFPLLLIQLLLHCFADKPPLDSLYSADSKGGNKPNPQVFSGFLKRISFIWFEPLAWKGYRHPLTTEDMYDLSPEDSTHELVPIFDKYWRESVAKGKRKSEKPMKSTGEKINMNKTETGPGTRRTNGSVLPAMVKAFGAPFWFAGVLKLVIDLISFAQPFLLGFLIDFTNDENAPLWHGIFYMVLLILVSFATAILNGQHLFRTFLVGFRIKTALISLIYRKALTISPAARKDTTVGEIVNLMAVDAQRFFETVQYLHLIWAGPLVIILAIYFLWQILGVAVVSGLVVMVLMIPLNGFIAAKMKTLQMKQMKQKDERVKLMNEILNGMKVLKLYAWEPSFENYVDEVRTKELNIIKEQAIWNVATFVLWTISPFMVTLFSFATFVLIEDRRIDAEIAFVSLTLFNIIRMPLVVFPMALAQALQCWVAIKRIDKYMNSEDLLEENITHFQSNDVVKIDKGFFSWGDGEVSLRNVNLTVERESLVAIVGMVGSGKSTLISAMLGEVEKIGGTVNTSGTIAYVPQQAWMQNATLKDNILFGKPLDQEFYDKVIDACALIPDLKMLPGGDQTEIGEKGINLSGGQKQRISLARAVYSQAEIYLLDDPLSAVDSHVGKHIFQRVIGPNGVLAGKTRVLVTHGITYLPEVSTIHVMKDGEISESGTYKQLLDEKGDFATFIEDHLKESVDEEELKEIQTVLEGNQVGATIFNRAISTRSSISDRRASKRVSKLSDKHQPFEETTPREESDNRNLMTKEESLTGAVKLGVYIRYFKSVGTMFMTVTMISTVAYQVFSVYSNQWLSQWSEDESSDLPEVRDMYLGIYGALGFGQTVFVLGMGLGMGIGCVYAARDLHNNLLRQTLRLPMSFFDTTPIGRIVNRFSKDVDTVDNVIPLILRFGNLMMFSVVSVIVIVSIQTPLFLVVIIPIGLVYYFIQSFYISTSRQLKRIESVTRSPVYSHFGETLTGQSTIRAYAVQNRFVSVIHDRVNLNQKCAYPSLVIANRWLAIRLELIGTFALLFAVLFAILNGNSGGSVGLSISYAMQITVLLNFVVRMIAEIETNIVANERMEEYNDLPKEAEWKGGVQVDKKWPTEGKVEFEDFKLRYRENLDLVLKGISLSVRGGEKVGIVGRTGAGKSSLTLGLFRIVEAAGGKIVIDGVDIAQLGLHSLRSRLTIIPQDPVLFSGTLRMNIDPLKVHTDEEIWAALEHSHLKTYVKNTPNGLDNHVTEGGDNLSVGQRQLLCLTRALLRKTKVLILDEATAAVDLETDDLIQRTIRSEFKECTILTIAHRLNTILDSDKVLVLDQGRIAEFDSPKILLENRHTVFYGMAKDAGLVGGGQGNGIAQ